MPVKSVDIEISANENPNSGFINSNPTIVGTVLLMALNYIHVKRQWVCFFFENELLQYHISSTKNISSISQFSCCLCCSWGRSVTLKHKSDMINTTIKIAHQTPFDNT